MELLVNIDVDDLEKGIEFYCRAFRLRLGRRLGETVGELLGASCPVYLLAKPTGSSACETRSAPRDYSRHWTPVHVDIAVEDIEAAVRRARDAGAVLEGEIQVHQWGHLATMSDPFGHGFCLIQFVGRGYDEIAS
jgi:predicted enzyme related to lactoylglutathione lyase